MMPNRSSAALQMSQLVGVAGLGALALLFAASATSQPAGTTKAFENSEYRYSVALPAGCRHDEGPGTLEAVCSAELDPDKSAEASATSSLVLEVTVEQVPDDAGKVPAALAQKFGEGEFRQELPEMVCGETDDSRVKIDNLAQAVEEARVVYTANVTCPGIKFLALGERRATARYLITPGLRYRLMARALTEDYEQRKEAIDAFFSSFKVLAQDKRNQ
jgi:hypothetical protein